MQFLKAVHCSSKTDDDCNWNIKGVLKTLVEYVMISDLLTWSTGISLDGDGCELSKSTDVKLYVHKIPYSIDPLLIEDNQCNFKMQSTTVLKDDDCSWNI